jgi:hypothetical protein
MYVDEVHRSAQSVQRHMPDLALTLYTNVSTDQIDGDLFDRVAPIPEAAKLIHPKEAKVCALTHTPYEQTLFLDSDTYLCDRVDELFDLLNAFDMAVAHDPNRYQTEDVGPGDIPRAFPELNTGVMVYRSQSNAVQDLLQAWRSCYRETAATIDYRDQPSFRKAAYESDIRLSILPPEYNCRFIYPNYLRGPVKVMHGRHDDLSLVERLLNASDSRRTTLSLGMRSRTNRLRILYQHLKETLRQTWAMLFRSSRRS